MLPRMDAAIEKIDELLVDVRGARAVTCSTLRPSWSTAG